MKRKRTKLASLTSVVNRMWQNIKACNKFMTNVYLDTLSLASLLRLVHPLDRKGLAFELFKNDFITEQEYKEMAKPWIVPGFLN